MNRESYQRRLQPAIDLMIDQLIYNENKHCEGIKLSDKDLLKAIGHGCSSMQNKPNDEPSSHAVAMLTNAAKVVLAEIERGE